MDGACARWASARRRSTPRIWRPACCSSRISAREPVVDAQRPDPERYAEADAVLAKLHGRDAAQRAARGRRPRPRDPALRYRSAADRGRAAARLVCAAHHRATSRPARCAAEFVNLWREALEPIVAAPATWTLRDYPFAQPDLAAGAGRPAARRHDRFPGRGARLTRPTTSSRCCRTRGSTCRNDLELKLLGHYARGRKAADPAFDMAAFARAYAMHGRAARHQDPRHLRPPRPAGRQAAISASTCRGSRLISPATSRIPALAELEGWYETHSPSLFRPHARPNWA